MLHSSTSLPFVLLALCIFGRGLPVTPSQEVLSPPKDTKVLILGGGVAGVIAARTLHEQGISEFIVVEAREELGGRMRSHTFGMPGNQYTVEVGANWVQGTQTGNGARNPIWALAKKHNLTMHPSHFLESITTYDDSGAYNYLDIFEKSVMHYSKLIASAGGRVPKMLVDMTARSGYSLLGAKPHSRHEVAAEYFQFDWEFGATPDETSWLASSWVHFFVSRGFSVYDFTVFHGGVIYPAFAHNYTFEAAAGGFSEDNLLSLDPHGFKTILQVEADSFLESHQLRLNSTVETIVHSKRGVQVLLADGEMLRADYALCTFSLGVLQHDDVKFLPPLPAWKQEAIHSMTMGTFTKIFMQFPEKFWFDTEMAVYADYERGRYPVWQSLDHKDFLPGSGILFVTVTGDFSRRIEALPANHVKSEVLSVLQTMYPDQTIPEPLDFYFQRWHSDPLFRGSYSNWPASFLSDHQGNLRANVNERLWFAGEATSKKHFGFLHGAYFEGQSIGLALAECIKGGGCVGLEHVDDIRNAGPYDTK
ncbi:amine oxidase [Obba rivulosa]|uniref:Amine oxidase n=1 Tax=Obba rivulosa TaxID=1052685 RepID=A0A8E2AZ46_9APHY|nr:amine oxidase [Obba rivulosa]